MQFRLESLALDLGVAALAREVYGGRFVPRVDLKGRLGGDADEGGKEAVSVYLMDRVKGVTHLDFFLARGYPEDSGENVRWRRNLVGNVAR